MMIFAPCLDVSSSLPYIAPNSIGLHTPIVVTTVVSGAYIVKLLVKAYGSLV